MSKEPTPMKIVAEQPIKDKDGREGKRYLCESGDYFDVFEQKPPDTDWPEELVPGTGPAPSPILMPGGDPFGSVLESIMKQFGSLKDKLDPGPAQVRYFCGTDIMEIQNLANKFLLANPEAFVCPMQIINDRIFIQPIHFHLPKEKPKTDEQS